MTEVWLKTYRSAGSFTFEATQPGLHRFHVVGPGGNGADGTNGSSPGGIGGGSGGYGIHSIALSVGETVEIKISQEFTKLTHGGISVTATAGNGETPGDCTGANQANLLGMPGGVGERGKVDTSPAYSWKRIIGGSGGPGGNSVGKYQNDGGSGGGGGWASGNTLSSDKPTHAKNGTVIENTDSKVGSAGGGGGNAASVYSSFARAGTGEIGQLGGVVVEFVSSAPTAPPWIDTSDRILAGKEVEVTWGNASDVNGDLAGYTLERSADGGPWQAVYKGSLRAFTDVAASDWQTLQYRVQAYDAEGSVSGYISTVKMTVIHNSPPEAPASIFVPEQIFGGTTVTVSWSRAADADSNLAGYSLEQSIDGGAWAEAINTTALSADIPVAFGCSTTQFRVRAYDTYGAVGEYVTSSTVTVINNRAPVISGEDRDLGTMTGAFEPITYTVDDPDGDEVEVTINLDGAAKSTFIAVLGQEYTIQFSADEWRKLLNGKHTVEIIANDRPPLGTRKVNDPEGRLPSSNLFGLLASGLRIRCSRTRCRKSVSSARRALSRKGASCVLRFATMPTMWLRHGRRSRKKS